MDFWQPATAPKIFERGRSMGAEIFGLRFWGRRFFPTATAGFEFCFQFRGEQTECVYLISINQAFLVFLAFVLYNPAGRAARMLTPITPVV